MLRFRLGDIPVDVHLSHLLVSGLFALSFRPQGSSSTPQQWPDRFLLDPSSPQYTQTLVLFVLGWMFLIFFSVLVHELGHALASKAFGYRPAIQLAWMGGHTTPNAPGPIPWLRDIALTLAGPGAGLLLAAASYGGLVLLGHTSEILLYFLFSFMSANLFWAILNLVPVAPLDGGRISAALLGRVFGSRGQAGAHFLGVGVAGAIALWAQARGQQMLVLFFAYFAFQSLMLALAHARPQARKAPALGALQLGQADALFREGKLAQAQGVVHALLPRTDDPQLRAKAHHLLGWISLKEGHGRDALDHFSQVQGALPVEPQALAAAFTLVGDDERALPLWREGYESSGDRTVLHEWAGTLLRLGRAEEARRLPGLDLATAYACAHRALFIRGDFAAAARLGHAWEADAPGPGAAYETACALARAGDREGALDSLRRASALGYVDAARAASDDDLATLKGDPGFQAWLRALPAN